MVKNFRYEQAGRIALSGAPESAEAVDWLHARGIRAVLSLHPVCAEVRARMLELGMAWRPLIITDFAAGVPADTLEALRFAADRAAHSPAVLIH